MKVKALITYNDLKLKRQVKKGEVISVSKQRASILLKGNNTSGNKPFVEIVEEEENVNKSDN